MLIKTPTIYLLGLALLTSSCSFYQPSLVHKVDIPLIKKDEYGLLRDVLVTEIAKSPLLEYSSEGSDYELRIELVKDKTENVSFFYEPDAKTGEITDKLIADEQMRTLVIKASLYSKSQKDYVVQPFFVTSRLDYNFLNPTSLSNVQFANTEGENTSLLQFSLGQLDSEEGAQLASYGPIFRQMSEKVMAIISHQLRTAREQNRL